MSSSIGSLIGGGYMKDKSRLTLMEKYNDKIKDIKEIKNTRDNFGHLGFGLLAGAIVGQELSMLLAIITWVIVVFFIMELRRQNTDKLLKRMEIVHGNSRINRRSKKK